MSFFLFVLDFFPFYCLQGAKQQNNHEVKLDVCRYDKWGFSLQSQEIHWMRSQEKIINFFICNLYALETLNKQHILDILG